MHNFPKLKDIKNITKNTNIYLLIILKILVLFNRNLKISPFSNSRERISITMNTKRLCGKVIIYQTSEGQRPLLQHTL